MCQNYLDGLMWITKYYFSNCPSWDWSYKFPKSPFITDISKFLKTYHYNVNDIEFTKSQSLNATTQLMCVIPKDYKYLLSKNHQKIMDDITLGDMFPSRFILDIANKDLFRNCLPILPTLDIERIKKINIPMNDILDKKEQDIIIR